MKRITKQLGLWGAISCAVGDFFYFFNINIFLAGVLEVISLILLITAYLRASQEFKEPKIKEYLVKSITFLIIGMVIFVFSQGGATIERLLSFLEKGELKGIEFLKIAQLIGAWMMLVVGCWFWYKTNVFLSYKTKIKLFKISGFCILIGSLLLIILIGIILGVVGDILLIGAWFKVEERV